MPEPTPAAPAQPPAARVPTSGIAVTALILGITAVVFAFIPVVNFLTYILGLAAVVLGIIAIITADGTKKRGRGLGIAGAVLGVVGVVIAIIVTVVVVGTLSAIDDAVTVEVDTSGAGGAAGTVADPLPFDTTVTLENGLVLTVGQPRQITPSESSFPDQGQEFFWAVEVTVSNEGQEDKALLGTSYGFLESGATCESFYDSEQFGDQFMNLDGSLPPGKNRSAILAFGCPSQGNVDLEITPDILGPTLYYRGAVSQRAQS